MLLPISIPETASAGTNVEIGEVSEAQKLKRWEGNACPIDEMA